MNTTRTATVSSGIDEAGKTLDTLLGTSEAGKGKAYEEVLIENTGDAALSIACLPEPGTPATADWKTIAIDDEVYLERILTDSTYIKTANDGETNTFEFTGTLVPAGG